MSCDIVVLQPHTCRNMGGLGNKTGLWRYRIGNYRVIADINDDRCIILALEVGHRKDIYK